MIHINVGTIYYLIHAQLIYSINILYKHVLLFMLQKRRDRTYLSHISRCVCVGTQHRLIITDCFFLTVDKKNTEKKKE